MYDNMNVNPDAMAAELAYRRSILIGTRSTPPAPHGRWRRRRAPRAD
jgi:hypothetical protein